MVIVIHVIDSYMEATSKQSKTRTKLIVVYISVYNCLQHRDMAVKGPTMQLAKKCNGVEALHHCGNELLLSGRLACACGFISFPLRALSFLSLYDRPTGIYSCFLTLIN